MYHSEGFINSIFIVTQYLSLYFNLNIIWEIRWPNLAFSDNFLGNNKTNSNTNFTRKSIFCLCYNYGFLSPYILNCIYSTIFVFELSIFNISFIQPKFMVKTFLTSGLEFKSQWTHAIARLVSLYKAGQETTHLLVSLAQSLKQNQWGPLGFELQPWGQKRFHHGWIKDI